jgi:signal transduction histidine kinase
VSEASQSRFELRALVPWFVLSVCLIMTALVTAFAAWVTEQQQAVRFQGAALDLESAVKARVELHIALLRGARGLFLASDEVTRVDFRRYTSQLNLSRNYAGIQGIGFTRRMLPDEVEPVRRWMTAQGITNFAVWPWSPRPEYHSILHLEPLDERNRAAIGFDMFSEGNRSNAMARARDTGLPAASGKVTLVQEIFGPKQAGFLIYVPVYRTVMPPASIEERRAQLLGFIYGPFRVDDLLRSITENAQPGLSLEVFDGEQTTEEFVLHRSKPQPDDGGKLRRVSRVEIAGRTWTLVLRSTRQFESTPLALATPTAAVLGLAASVLLFAAASGQRRAEKVAQQSAAELHVAQQELRAHATELERRVRERTAALEETVKSLESFSYSIAHDLRSPLRTIHSFSDLLLTDYQREIDSTGQDYLSRIREAAGRMDRLIQDLLAYGRVSQENLALERIDLDVAVAAVLHELRDEIQQNEATIVALPTGFALRANGTLLHQVLSNLLGNALKFVDARKPHVTITAQRAGTLVRVSIADNGIGIAPELHGRIFGLFERLHTPGVYPGTGIGLAIVAKAIERMNGRVGVDSTPGAGSTFWFELPAA